MKPVPFFRQRVGEMHKGVAHSILNCHSYSELHIGLSSIERRAFGALLSSD